ncbi:MAG TPA: HAMP domain-containing protein, partial [Stellaceae bacterium]|nr:HAMP domain-containing protein [Stellaceae bacterium]
MLNRCSVNFLLKSVILVVSGALVIVFALGAWDAYSRFNNASRVADLTQTSGAVFRAMNALRIDRNFTGRVLTSETPAPGDQAQMDQSRAAGMPFFQEAANEIGGLDFPGQAEYAKSLPAVLKQLQALQAETLTAMKQPLATRRAGLVDEYTRTDTQALDVLGSLNDKLAAAVKLQDPRIDEMMTLQTLAWTARQAGGDASIGLSDGMRGVKFGDAQLAAFEHSTAIVQAVWTSFAGVANGTVLPAKLTVAVDKTNKVWFDPAFQTERERLAKLMASGGTVDVDVKAWTVRSLTASQSQLDVVLAALDAANDRAVELRGEALRSLGLELVFVALAMIVALGSMLVIGRRVIRPLHAIRDAMVKLAGGDLTVDVGNAERQDEIGALFGTLAIFRDNAVEKQRIEDEQKQRHADAVKRQEGIELSIKAFEKEVGGALQALDKAS